MPQKPSLSDSIDREHPLFPRAGCWLFNEGGGSKAFDVARRKNGTLTNGPLWIPGRDGSALQFDGTNDHVLITPHTRITPPFSVVMWINDANTASNVKPWFSHDSNDNDGFRIMHDSFGELQLIYGGVAVYSFGLPITQDVWTQIAVTVNGTSGAGYVNLKRATASVGTMDGTPTQTSIGGFLSSSQYFGGKIGNVFVFDRALTHSEIAALYVDPYPFISPRRIAFKAPSGLADRTADASISLGAFTLTSAATNAVAASSAQSLGAATCSGVGANATGAAASINLGAATSTSAAANAVAAVGGVSLGAAASSGAATVAIGAAGSVALGGITLAGAATVAIAADSSQSIGSITVSGAAGAVTASASISIGAISLVAGAAVAMAASGAVSVGGITCTGTNVGISQDTTLTTTFDSSVLTTGYADGILTTEYESR